MENIFHYKLHSSLIEFWKKQKILAATCLNLTATRYLLFEIY